MTKGAGKTVPYRVGEWLPSDQEKLEAWLGDHIKQTGKRTQPLHPVVQEFKDVVDANPQLSMLFHQMFDQVPHRPPYNKSPSEKRQVRSYEHMIDLINAVMTKAPEFNETGLVGCPINAILDWSMGTSGGFAAFLDDRVNVQLKKLLCEWGTFLKSEDSRYVLSKDAHNGWFGEDAQRKMPNFAEEFECDPGQPHHGFKSWDDFFTRRFRPGVRPVASPEDDNIIVSACESAPYRIATDVQREENFWIKAQPYSLRHMLNNDARTDLFVGGTIYQAFLSALSYHRWHSPVNGRIVKTEVVNGTYYSETPTEGFDPAGPDRSQGYITHTATRGLIFIEADNPAIGLMCFMAVGMAEVSTCDITAFEGQRIKKGDQTGMFHFGGSTHCLFFRPGVNVEFDLHDNRPGLGSSNIPINSKLACIRHK